MPENSFLPLVEAVWLIKKDYIWLWIPNDLTSSIYYKQNEYVECKMSWEDVVSHMYAFVHMEGFLFSSYVAQSTEPTYIPVCSALQ